VPQRMNITFQRAIDRYVGVPICAIDCELFARVGAIFSFLSGAPVRVGFFRHAQAGLYRGTFINRGVMYERSVRRRGALRGLIRAPPPAWAQEFAGRSTLNRSYGSGENNLVARADAQASARLEFVLYRDRRSRLSDARRAIPATSFSR
jgi:hypothetical protein